MDARKCDRCGKYYDLYNTDNDKPNTIKFVSLNEKRQYCEGAVKSFDLCPECMKAAKKFMEG